MLDSMTTREELGFALPCGCSPLNAVFTGLKGFNSSEYLALKTVYCGVVDTVLRLLELYMQYRNTLLKTSLPGTESSGYPVIYTC
ncbi:hypothetical protein [Desulfurococcus amylolyticus]|nr:hypothetical protein [Desulfurococcus amylolyticus]